MGLPKRKDEWTAGQLIEQLSRLHVAGPDLKALVQLTQDFVNEELQRRVANAKQSRDGKDLPVQIIRQQFISGRCHCDAAAYLSSEAKLAKRFADDSQDLG